ncbi:MAG TPA: hypothetical protein VME69_04355 [Methylocella sp.]|nr:hypothetical protein [Methylocella sp.]
MGEMNKIAMRRMRDAVQPILRRFFFEKWKSQGVGATATNETEPSKSLDCAQRNKLASMWHGSDDDAGSPDLFPSSAALSSFRYENHATYVSFS